MNNVLLIFTKNPVHGKVKTRLAATIGNNKALDIYKKLIQHTYTVTMHLNCNKIVFYSDQMEADDVWKKDYQKELQRGDNLGERMINAFEFAFQKEFLKAVIIGTDCPGLNSIVLNDAFHKLDKDDVVIGPAADGGYYLLGMKNMHLELLKNITWSTNTVLEETINRCNENNLQYFLLPTLNDVDEEKDLKYLKNMK